MKPDKKTLYIALLRGINVGGHFVKMDALRSVFVSLGFENVRSYIQSGNIFFETAEQDKLRLRKTIEPQLQKSLGFPVVICLRTVTELQQLLALDPFQAITVTPDMRLAVVFLAEPVVIDIPLPFLTPDGGYELVGKTPTELFVVWHVQHTRTSNSYSFFEKQFRVQTTTRFWHTAAKILAAAEISQNTTD
jgi:uncharacterized protein (DUF1697 family)